MHDNVSSKHKIKYPSTPTHPRKQHGWMRSEDVNTCPWTHVSGSDDRQPLALDATCALLNWAPRTGAGHHGVPFTTAGNSSVWQGAVRRTRLRTLGCVDVFWCASPVVLLTPVDAPSYFIMCSHLAVPFIIDQFTLLHVTLCNAHWYYYFFSVPFSPIQSPKT